MKKKSCKTTSGRDNDNDGDYFILEKGGLGLIFKTHKNILRVLCLVSVRDGLGFVTKAKRPEPHCAQTRSFQARTLTVARMQRLSDADFLSLSSLLCLSP